MHAVTILQEYIPHYRIPFFVGLREALAADDVKLRVLSGNPSPKLRARGDAGQLDFGEKLNQREFNFAGRRIVFRDIRSAIRGTDMLITEQSRRNLDIYPLLLHPPREIKIALWGHGKDLSQSSSGLESLLLRGITRRAHWFFAYTESAAVDAVNARVADPAKVTAVNNTIDIGRIRREMAHAKELASQMRRSLEFPMDAPVVAYIGALTESKRIDRLVAAFQHIHRKRRDVRFLIAGKGAELERIESARRTGLPVETIGYAGDSEKAAISQVASFLLIPDQVGLIAIDSFAMGTPIVTARNGHHGPEFSYLCDTRNALLSDPDPASLGDTGLRLLSSMRMQSELSAACLESAEFYGMDRMVERFRSGVLSALHAR